VWTSIDIFRTFCYNKTEQPELGKREKNGGRVSAVLQGGLERDQKPLPSRRDGNDGKPD